MYREVKIMPFFSEYRRTEEDKAIWEKFRPVPSVRDYETDTIRTLDGKVELRLIAERKGVRVLIEYFMDRYENVYATTVDDPNLLVFMGTLCRDPLRIEEVFPEYEEATEEWKSEMERMYRNRYISLDGMWIDTWTINLGEDYRPPRTIAVIE